MRLQYILGLACGLALTTSVSAQTGAPTPKPAPPPAPPAQTNLYPPALYRMNDVNKSLNLNQEQLDRLNKLTDQTQAQYRDNYNKINMLNDADRYARIQAMNREYYSDWNKGARDIFNNEQRSRYQQLNYQYGGFNSLNDPDIQRGLNLTPDQLKNLRQSVDLGSQQLQEINRIGATDPEKGAKLYREYWMQHPGAKLQQVSDSATAKGAAVGLHRRAVLCSNRPSRRLTNGDRKNVLMVSRDAAAGAADRR